MDNLWSHKVTCWKSRKLWIPIRLKIVKEAKVLRNSPKGLLQMIHFNRGLWLPFPRILYEFYVYMVSVEAICAWKIVILMTIWNTKTPRTAAIPTYSANFLPSDSCPCRNCSHNHSLAVKLFQKHPPLPSSLGFRFISWKEAFLHPGCWGLGGWTVSSMLSHGYALRTTPGRVFVWPCTRQMLAKIPVLNWMASTL